MSVSRTPYATWVDRVAARMGRVLVDVGGDPLTIDEASLCRRLAKECVNKDPIRFGLRPCRHCGELTTPAGHWRSGSGICDPEMDPRPRELLGLPFDGGAA